ncbi:hypothetical protein KPL40_13375 [Clostridium gasigenes]|uniref:hypothetical protein n=1 Tax=Clostridium gasigenes TaxID=94869 RepID=UPI00143869A0|nr:hypothetical protein [Clostridium gasigenes]MBU3133440.1 hypothetical protein [Clostridium gasigenes]NKF07697.1 hypothetical protein [Clostridium gasigenes]
MRHVKSYLITFPLSKFEFSTMLSREVGIETFDILADKFFSAVSLSIFLEATLEK